MHELRPEETAAFLDRWGDFHDSMVQEITFHVSAQRATVKLLAQDGAAEWVWHEVTVVIEGLSDFTCRQPPRYDAQIIFEAGICWADDGILSALDGPSDQDPDAFRASDTYFGGQRLLWEAAPIP